MSLGTLSICVSVLVLNLHYKGAEQKVPKWLYTLILVWLAKGVCVRTTALQAHKDVERTTKMTERQRINKPRKELVHLIRYNHATHQGKMTQPAWEQCNGQEMVDSSSPVSDTSPSQKEDEEAEQHNDWQEMAHVLDRLFFWVLFFTMTFSSLIIFSRRVNA